jgi:signal transduction histidine kinase
MRPLERLPTIRAKLGSTIVFAVGVTIILVYVLFGYALRNSQADTEWLKLMAIANRAASTEVRALPKGTRIETLDRLNGFTEPSIGQRPPAFLDGKAHWGISNGIEYAAVPKVVSGKQVGTVYAVRTAPDTGVAGGLEETGRFLRHYWWQLLAAGAGAAAVALLLARWLARGMTQPLREMAEAAHKMERGDYSERVHTRSRDEVGQLAEAFNRMSAELDGVERLRRDLVANVSHELKTPISALRAHLENLLDGIEEPNPETLAVMLNQSERLGRLVEEVLDLSRLESGDVPLARDAIDLEPLVSEVVSEIQVVSADRRVSVDSEVPPGLPPALADRNRVHQVLFNLLDNAVRFTPEGGRVGISAVRHNGCVQVRVSDTGVGIPQEHLPRLFERFYRVDSARSRGDGGTGIGLAIARSVIEAHGGRIWAESTPGRGSVFAFELPVAAPGLARPSPAKQPHRTTSSVPAPDPAPKPRPRPIPTPIQKEDA